MLFCKKYNLQYKSIYIANPWGPLEEKKLNYYLISNWIKNKNITISHPRYIRDNIYIDKKIKKYVKIVYSKSKKIDYFPSGYCSTNKEFIEAFKIKFERFFNKKVNVSYSKETIYDQPLTRINVKEINLTKKSYYKRKFKQLFQSIQIQLDKLIILIYKTFY